MYPDPLYLHSLFSQLYYILSCLFYAPDSLSSALDKFALEAQLLRHFIPGPYRKPDNPKYHASGSQNSNYVACETTTTMFGVQKAVGIPALRRMGDVSQGKI